MIFEKLLDKNQYQVFLFVSAAHFPFIFASHPWFVLNKKGQISRWEVLHRKNSDNFHIHKDTNPLFRGIQIFAFYNKLFWRAKLIKKIEGESAKDIINFIEESKDNYQHGKIYSLRGVNSNTYARWILKNFPEFNAKLPWNSFGK